MVLKLPALRGGISRGLCKGQAVDFQWDYVKTPWLKNGKQKVTVGVTISGQVLVLNLKPERETLGSLFPT